VSIPFCSTTSVAILWHGWSVANRCDTFWGFSYSLWRMLCNYSLEGCAVVNVCRKGRP